MHPFNVGTRVRIVGLQNKPEFNGLCGVIKEFDSNGRAEVLLDRNLFNKEGLSVRAQNLEMLHNHQIQDPMHLLSVFINETDNVKVVDMEIQMLPIAESFIKINPVIANGIYERLATAHTVLRNFAEAVEMRHKVLTVSQRIGDPCQLCTAHGNLGIALVDVGQATEGLYHHNASLQIAETIANISLQGSAHGNIGNALQCLGNFPAAAAAHRQHLLLARAAGDTAAQSRALANLGNALLSAGDAREALSLFRELLADAEARGDEARVGVARSRVGAALQARSPLPTHRYLCPSSFSAAPLHLPFPAPPVECTQ